MKKFEPIKLPRKIAVDLIRSVIPISPKAIEGGEQAHKLVDQYWGR